MKEGWLVCKCKCNDMSKVDGLIFGNFLSISDS